MGIREEGVYCQWCNAVETYADHRRMHPECVTCSTPTAYRLRRSLEVHKRA